MQPFEGRRIPLVFWDKEEDYRRFRLSLTPDSGCGEHQLVDGLEVLA